MEDLPMISRSRLAASRPRSGELAMGLSRTHATNTNSSHHIDRRRRTTPRQISQFVFTISCDADISPFIVLTEFQKKLFSDTVFTLV
ncbi:hypothetical protein B5X24_HaOG210447 [Helicoverpa armigera]|nr:hypothetical protein B5X24_HaOG210447 [Helicoverpa armigera]